MTIKEKIIFYTQREKQYVWEDVFFSMFVDSIKHDYTIPWKGDIDGILPDIIQELKASKSIPKKLMVHIETICFTYHRDEYSPLSDYLDDDSKFGYEFFYGLGTLFRWRPGEMEKANERIARHINKRENKALLSVKEIVRKHIDSNIKKWKRT